MLTPVVEEALNDQIQKELYSAYVYLAMCAYLEQKALPGCANWMKHQAHEELDHAMKLFDYIADRGGKALLRSIDAPPAEFGTPIEVFTTALEHERSVTKSIENLYALSVKEADYATQNHLQWFIDEQVEEEKSATEIVDMFTLAGDHTGAILMIDQKLGQRQSHEH